MLLIVWLKPLQGQRCHVAGSQNGRAAVQKYHEPHSLPPSSITMEPLSQRWPPWKGLSPRTRKGCYSITFATLWARVLPVLAQRVTPCSAECTGAVPARSPGASSGVRDSLRDKVDLLARFSSGLPTCNNMCEYIYIYIYIYPVPP